MPGATATRLSPPTGIARRRRASTREQWLSQPEKNPHSAAHYGVYAFKPKSQLAIVDTGIDPYMGVAAWLEAHRQNEFKYRPAQDRTAVQRFGEMTGAEVLQILLPLFIVLMTFSAFSGEREQGTLRPLLSLGVRRRDLVLGEALGIGAGLALVLLPSLALGIVAMAMTVEGGLLAGDPWRAVLLAGVYAAYFALMIAVSLGVSAWASSSRLALVVLLSFWFANSLIASRAAADLAGALHPTPSAIEFQKAMEVDLNDREELQQRLDQQRAELMRKHNVASFDALPIAFSGISFQEGEEHANRVYQLPGVVAPLLAVRSLSMGLAGTDFLQHRELINHAEAYRRDIQRIMNDDIVRHQKPGQVYLADRALWEQVPTFEYDAPPVGWVLGAYTMSLLVLALWLVAGVFAVAIGYGVWNGVRWVDFQTQALAEAGAEEQERYDGLRQRVDEIVKTGAQVSPFADPRSPSNVGSRLGPRYAMLPPGPLAPLAIGQSDLLPYYFRISTDSRENILAATEIENPHRLLTGRFDLAFVVIFLYPLLILAVTYNMLSAEKEQGTLAMALSQPVALRTLVTGKVMLRAALLVGTVVAFSGVALLLSGANLSAPGAPLRLVVWVAAVAAYGAFWFSLAVLVASFGRPSAVNARRARLALARARDHAAVALQSGGHHVLPGALARRDGAGHARGVGRGQRGGQQAARVLRRGPSGTGCAGHSARAPVRSHPKETASRCLHRVNRVSRGALPAGR